MRAKTLLLLLTCLGAANFSQAQYADIPSNDAGRLSMSVGGGITTLYGDLKEKQISPAFRVNIDYNIMSFISLGIEGQFGRLAEGNKEVTEANEGLYMKSSYRAINVNAKLKPGQLITPTEDPLMQLVRGLYIGAGVGSVGTTVNKIVDTYQVTKTHIKGTVTTSATEIAFPINLGIDYSIPRTDASINVNYQYNFTQGETLDGYDFNVTGNKRNDGYSFLSVGIKYYLGRSRSSSY